MCCGAQCCCMSNKTGEMTNAYFRFSVNKPRPTNPLEAIKFICKDLWILVFRKQIDNLKTNHRGIFVLTDTRFQAIGRMSVDRRAGPKAVEDAMERAQTVG